MENRDPKFERLVEIKTKIYRANKSIEFLQSCKTNQVYPAFTIIPSSTLQHVNWSPDTIQQKRLEKVNLSIKDQQQRIEKNEIKLSQYINLNFSSDTKRTLTKIIYKVDNYIINNEKNNDRKRSRKLTELKKNIKSKIFRNSNFQFF